MGQKKIFALAFILSFFMLGEIQAQISFPYFENFETGQAGWTPQAGPNIWNFGTPNFGGLTGAYSGVNAFATFLTANYPNSNTSYLNSPIFRFSTLTEAPYLRFKYNIITESCCDKLWVEYSLDNGINWNVLGNAAKGQNWYNNENENYWSGNSNGWKIASIKLDTLPLTQDVQFRMVFNSDHSQNAEGAAIDDIEVISAYDDIEITALTSPVVNACSYAQNESIELSISNLGQNDINNINVSCQIDTFPVISQAINLVASQSSPITFLSNANLQQDGIHELKIWLTAPGDVTAVNDTLKASLTNLVAIQNYPYSEGFEAGIGDWVSGGDNNTWAFGKPSKQIIRGANSGDSAWVTGGLNYGNYNNNEHSYVLSPCFNTANLVNPQIRLANWFKTESGYDGANIEYTNNDGLSWQVLDGSTKYNWYNQTQLSGLDSTQLNSGWSGNSNGWQFSTVNNSALSNQGSLRFRINFGSDVNTRDEGFAFDDFTVLESPTTDLSIKSLTNLNYALCTGDSDSLVVEIVNLAASSTSTFTIGYLFGNTFRIDTVNTAISAGGAASYYLGNISSTQATNATLKVFVNTVNDGLPFNDTVYGTVNIYAPAAPATASNEIVCLNSRALLTSGDAALVTWYKDAALSLPIFVGDTFLTGPIAGDTTFYFKNFNGMLDTIGARANGIGSGGYTNASVELDLVANRHITLLKANIYADQIGSFVVDLLNDNGQSIRSRTISVPTIGFQEVILDLNMAPGTYKLKVNNFSGSRLYRNTAGADYENYTSGNDFIILGNNFSPDFYYYFYNMVLAASEPCPSNGSASISVGNIAPTADFKIEQDKNRIQFVNQSQSGANFSWTFENLDNGTNTASNAISPFLVFDTASYNVRLIAENSCGLDTIEKSLVVDAINGMAVSKGWPKGELLLYPNPVSFQLKWNIQGKADNIKTVKIYTLFGSEILSLSGNALEENMVDVGNLPSGTYLIEVRSSENTYVSRFIKN